MAVGHFGKQIINHKSLLVLTNLFLFSQVPTFVFIVNYIFTRHSKDLKAAVLGHTLSFGLNGVIVGKAMVQLSP